jgi:DNA-binding GntR family transcriptional regulator
VPQQPAAADVDRGPQRPGAADVDRVPQRPAAADVDRDRRAAARAAGEERGAVAGRTPRGPVAAEQAARGPVPPEQATRGSVAAEQVTYGSVAAERATQGPVAPEQATRGPVAPEQAARGSVAAEPAAYGSVAAEQAPHGPVAPEQATRGEHVHSEQPYPRPRPRPVQRASVRGQILDALRHALVSGDLTPGEVYSAPALGERFGVSATPVREAMQLLALEGAVEVVPNRGFRVLERGTRELTELAEVRALIEVPVVLRLARTVPAERWAQLRPLAEATVRAASSGCRATYAEADRAFHRALLSLAGNEQLVRIAGDLHRRAQWPLPGTTPARDRTNLTADAADHSALLDALIARDLDVVRAVLGEHFHKGP